MRTTTTMMTMMSGGEDASNHFGLLLYRSCTCCTIMWCFLVIWLYHMMQIRWLLSDKNDHVQFKAYTIYMYKSTAQFTSSRSRYKPSTVTGIYYITVCKNISLFFKIELPCPGGGSSTGHGGGTPDNPAYQSSLVELGKKLLACARDGDTEGVRSSFHNRLARDIATTPGSTIQEPGMDKQVWFIPNKTTLQCQCTTF